MQRKALVAGKRPSLLLLRGEAGKGGWAQGSYRSLWPCPWWDPVPKEGAKQTSGPAETKPSNCLLIGGWRSAGWVLSSQGR